MTQKLFLKLLCSTIGILLIVLTVIHSFQIFRPHIGLSIGMVVMFVLLAIVNYTLGEKAVQSDNKYLYNNLIIGNFILKMICSISIVVAYVKIIAPTDTYFVMPFIVIYVIFTIFEVTFMMKQANVNPKI